jgi:hypothetical protein
MSFELQLQLLCCAAMLFATQQAHMQRAVQACVVQRIAHQALIQRRGCACSDRKLCTHVPQLTEAAVAQQSPFGWLHLPVAAAVRVFCW